MDKNTHKVLKFFNSHPQDFFTISEVAKFYPDLSTKDIREIIYSLYNNDYVRFVGDAKFQATNKGKTYFSTENDKWLSANIMSFLALIVSILTFIRTL